MFCRHVFGNISGGFHDILRFLGNFAEIPEFGGSATARNIRSPEQLNTPEKKNLTLYYFVVALAPSFTDHDENQYYLLLTNSLQIRLCVHVCWMCNMHIFKYTVCIN